MTLSDLKIVNPGASVEGPDKEVISNAFRIRTDAVELFAEEKIDEALAKVVEALRTLRDAQDFSRSEFRQILAILLYDLAEIHFELKDYKQSEKDLEALFKVLDVLVNEDADRFGHYHVLAMELSTRILRSRKKTLDLLAKQQINTGVLYEKVNAGVAAATDKLVESLRKGAEMMAQTGDYQGAVRFFMEAIKLAKKRSGRVSRREVRMTVEMARVMMHSRNESQRALRLLKAVLPHAVALENLDLEQEIIALSNQIENNLSHDSLWKSFMEKVQLSIGKVKGRKAKSDDKKAK